MISGCIEHLFNDIETHMGHSAHIRFPFLIFVKSDWSVQDAWSICSHDIDNTWGIQRTRCHRNLVEYVRLHRAFPYTSSKAHGECFLRSSWTAHRKRVWPGNIGVCITSPVGTAQLHHLVGGGREWAGLLRWRGQSRHLRPFAEAAKHSVKKRPFSELPQYFLRLNPKAGNSFWRTTAYRRQWMNRPDTTHRINGDIYTCYLKIVPGHP
jgi:hypothetical protein